MSCCVSLSRHPREWIKLLLSVPYIHVQPTNEHEIAFLFLHSMDKPTKSSYWINFLLFPGLLHSSLSCAVSERLKPFVLAKTFIGRNKRKGMHVDQGSTCDMCVVLCCVALCCVCAIMCIYLLGYLYVLSAGRERETEKWSHSLSSWVPSSLMHLTHSLSVSPSTHNNHNSHNINSNNNISHQQQLKNPNPSLTRASFATRKESVNKFTQHSQQSLTWPTSSSSPDKHQQSHLHHLLHTNCSIHAVIARFKILRLGFS